MVFDIVTKKKITLLNLLFRRFIELCCLFNISPHFLYFLTATFMVLHGTMNMCGPGFGFQDTMNFSSALMSFSPFIVRFLFVSRVFQAM